MSFGSTAKVLLNCKLKYYRISECIKASRMPDGAFPDVCLHNGNKTVSCSRLGRDQLCAELEGGGGCGGDEVLNLAWVPLQLSQLMAIVAEMECVLTLSEWRVGQC